jgi:hypothetical protein
MCFMFLGSVYLFGLVTEDIIFQKGLYERLDPPEHQGGAQEHLQRSNFFKP